MKNTKSNILALLIVAAFGIIAPTSLAQDNDDVVATNIFVPLGTATNALAPDGGETVYGFNGISAPNPWGVSAPPDSPALYTNFYGTGQDTGYHPPDTDGAAGTNALMIMINGRVRIRDRSGAPILLTNLNGWWSGAGSYPGGYSYVFDPHVLYDPYNDRWIAVAGANPDNANLNSQLLIGVSASSDPTGAWYQYAYNVDTNRQYWADYPEIGFSKDKIVVTFTRYTVTSETPSGSGMYVFDKNSLYTGATPISSISSLSAATYGYFLQPAITYDTNISTVYMVQNSNPNNNDGYGYVRLYAVTGAATNVTVTKVGTAKAAAWSASFSTNHGPQLGTTVRVDTGDNRAHQAVYRSGSIWFAHTIGLPAVNPGRSAIQFWQLGTNAAVIQQGRIQDTTSVTNYAYPTIAVNRFGEAMIGFSMFAANMYPSAGYAFQSALDTRGAFESVALLAAGLGPYWWVSAGTDIRNRWGDYSATRVDPVNDTDFWTLQEYAWTYLGTLTNGSGQWEIQWGNLALPVPGNDNFANAYVLSGGQGTTNGTTLRAATEAGEPNHGGVTNAPSVWYSWAAPSSGMVTFIVSSNAAPMILAAYAGSSVGSLTLVTNSGALRVTFNASSSTTYHIAVAANYGNNPSPGTFSLSWSQPSAPFFLVTPQTTNVAVGETVTLASLAIGTPNPVYQWRLEGTNLPSATNATLSITNVQFANGTNYAVIASNSLGSVTSAVVALIIWPNSSARLGYAQLDPSNSLIFQVAGLTNRPYRIVMSTNLSNPTNWVPVFTNYVSYWYTNSAISNAGQSFYRAITN